MAADSGRLRGRQLAGGLVMQRLLALSVCQRPALDAARWACFIPGHTVRGGGVVPASGRAGNWQATGCSLTFAQL